MCRVPGRIQRLLLCLDLVDACRVNFRRFAKVEWSSEDHAPRGVSLKAVTRQFPGPHREARFAAAIASLAFEYL